MNGTPPEQRRGRLSAIDALRGLVMVLMVLDHARDFYFGPARIRPTDLTVTTPLLFATRFVTHFCAPVFVFLAGTSAFLYGRKRPDGVARFLLGRGFFLVLLEITVVRLCWIPDPFYSFTLLQVIWAIGWSMVLLSLVTRLPPAAVAGLGGAVVVLHNLFDGVHAARFGDLSWLWSLLHERAMLAPLPGKQVFVSYPIVPWFGVMALGYGYGVVAAEGEPERSRRTLRIGALATALFLLVRAVNVYGDPVPWAPQRTAVYTVMSFLNCEKYPPSLAYVLMTLGPALMLLAWLDRAFARAAAASPGEAGAPRALAPLVVLGGVPLFFYVAHLALLRYTSAPLAFAKFGPSAFRPPPGHAGSPEYDLWVTYLAWVLAVVALYPVSRRFRRLKEAHPNGLLRFF